MSAKDFKKMMRRPKAELRELCVGLRIPMKPRSTKAELVELLLEESKALGFQDSPANGGLRNRKLGRNGTDSKAGRKGREGTREAHSTASSGLLASATTSETPGLFMSGVTLDLLPFVVALYYLALCPFTKVEESFNTQAVHDLLYRFVSTTAETAGAAGGAQGGQPLFSIPSLGINVGGGNGTLLHLGPGSAGSGSGGRRLLLSIGAFDHFEFPGVVPRSFIGALWLAFWAAPARLIGLPKLLVFAIARAALAASLAICTRALRLAAAADRDIGPIAAALFPVLTACQFHLPFYASRPLPNTFALCLVALAHAHWFRRSYARFVFLMVMATVVFRCDVLVLLGPAGISLLLRRELGFFRAVFLGLGSGVACLAMTVAIDSVFWGRLIWPEGVVLFYNTVLNKSSNWGTEPWHWYFTNALPRAMLLAYPLLPAGMIKIDVTSPSSSSSSSSSSSPSLSVSLPLPLTGGHRLRLSPCATGLALALPTLSYVALYSILPHKELRFIFPAVLLLNLVAATGMARLMTAAAAAVAAMFSYSTSAEGSANKKEHAQSKEKTKATPSSSTTTTTTTTRRRNIVHSVGLLACLGPCLAASAIFLAAAASNYPGGWAMLHLDSSLPSSASQAADMGEGGVGEGEGGRGRGSSDVSAGFVPFVHIAVKPAMTGVSRFLEREDGSIRYSKDESVARPSDLRSYTHALAAAPLDEELYGVEGAEWKIKHTENEFAGLGAFVRGAKVCFQKRGDGAKKMVECLRGAWAGRPGILVLERVATEEE